MERGAFSVAARWRSIGYAVAGLRLLLGTEHNARVHLLATIVVVAIGLGCRLPLTEWRWLCLALALVWIAEAFNTALERLCDRVSRQHDPLIGAAKDLSAGAVLVAALAAAAIGLLTFLPHLPEFRR